ncbi:hypothetical protein P6F26_16680 [Roseibacterium sp. SDUM158017]|uniref:hypothetical protein n=1 Tax=Roseicyclus salinarum TaxID=3036773 RepID=UPI0024151405|nr:hypothetical protein [Roseibacterium sp. SDUM158017]MDG4650085.1 hypothetical protein [Roseibacterium sp. SDUM158017]
MSPTVILCAPSHPLASQLRGRGPIMRVTYIGPLDRAEVLAAGTMEGRLIVHIDPRALPFRIAVGAPLPCGIEACRTWFEGSDIHPNATARDERNAA